MVSVPPANPAPFYRIRPAVSNCLSLAGLPLGARPNPWETNRFKIEALSAAGAMLPQNTIASRGGFTGLDVVHLDVFQTSGYATFEVVGQPTKRCLSFSNATAGQFQSPPLSSVTITVTPGTVDIGPVSGLGEN